MLSDEELRLECLREAVKLANVAFTAGGSVSEKSIVDLAQSFYEFVSPPVKGA